jgi:hypothetical protein
MTARSCVTSAAKGGLGLVLLTASGCRWFRGSRLRQRLTFRMDNPSR